MRIRLLFILSTATLLISCNSNKSEKLNDFDTFYNSYEKSEGVMSFELSSFLFKMLAKGDFETKKAVSKVEHVRIFISKDNSGDLFEKLNDYISPKIYEELTVINEEPAKITVYVRKQNKKINEVLTVVEENNHNFAVMQVKGEFEKDEVKDLIKSVDIKEAMKMHR